MASYKGHLAVSIGLGIAYGGAGFYSLGLDWGAACLGGCLTAIGGLLPDLDSDTSVPVREVFGLAATVTPLLLLSRLNQHGFSTEQKLVVMIGIYFCVRYGARLLLHLITVHRGMFHSIPAMVIAGLAVFLLHLAPRQQTRLFLAGGVMVGFLSHLVLDELYGVNFLGVRFKRQKGAGSPLKLFSSSWIATVTTYLILGVLGLAAWNDSVR